MPDFRPDRHDHLRPSRLPVILLAALVVAGIGYGLYRWQHLPPASGAPPASPGGETAEAAAPAPAQTGAAEPAPDAATARALLESLSPLEPFRRWVADGDAVRRWAVVTDNLAEGVSPRRVLSALAPAAPFSVEVEGGGAAQVMSAASYRRYDRFADAIAAVDLPTAVRVYRALKTPLEAAYRALGYPEGSFDRITERALLRLERAPVRDGPVEVVKSEGLYTYADPRLESLGPVEKHLLRMGPRNARLVQAKAKALRETLFPTQSNAPAAGAGR